MAPKTLMLQLGLKYLHVQNDCEDNFCPVAHWKQ